MLYLSTYALLFYVTADYTLFYNHKPFYKTSNNSQHNMVEKL